MPAGITFCNKQGESCENHELLRNCKVDFSTSQITFPTGLTFAFAYKVNVQDNIFAAFPLFSFPKTPICFYAFDFKTKTKVI